MVDHYFLIFVFKPVKMKRDLLCLVAFLIGSSSFGQGIYLEPEPIFIDSQTARLYVDVSSADCSCPELQDADPDTNPLYIWSWQPSEDRPDLIIDGQLVNVLNGNWTDSNENLRMSVDENNPNLWYYDFQNVTLSEFYDVPSSDFENGISFIVKEKNGNPDPELPEQKSPDLNILFNFSTQGIGEFDISFETIATGISSPTTITHAKDERIFVTEQEGTIRTFDRQGNLDPTLFLDIIDRVTSGGETGLLGLAFPSDFCESGRFYVNYTATDGGLVTRISRFEVDENNPLIGDPDSEEILIQFTQDFSNHNGGHIEFGPDGFLYIGTGDGGSGGDPNNRAQDITSYLGKMLRIDVSPETGYDIPSDNPYVSDDFGQDEIWSYGLRNPWKFAFDRETGNLYIADVGQNAFEEISFEPEGSIGGRNYGWRCYEGQSNFNLSDCDSDGEFVFPIFDYPHPGNFQGASITGGRVYRGISFENFEGWYFYTDLLSGEYGAVVQAGTEIFSQEFGEIGQSFITTWGEDAWGEIYFANGNGIYRLLDPTDEIQDPVIQDGSILTSLFLGDSYEWSLDGNIFSIESTGSIEITQNGTYTVTVFQEGESCGTPATIEVNSLGLNRIAANNQYLKVYPNPAQNLLAIELKDVEPTLSVLSIFSIEGRLLKEIVINSKKTFIDISTLDSGTYLVSLVNKEGKKLGNKMLVKR